MLVGSILLLSIKFNKALAAIEATSSSVSTKAIVFNPKPFSNLAGGMFLASARSFIFRAIGGT